jgi:hypothetical protein
MTKDQCYVCAGCKNVFLQPPLCTTCGAEKLYDATVRNQAATIEHLREELRKYAFHKGDGEFSNIEYCNYCGYSRDWIVNHSHGETCPLRKQS